MVMPKPTPTDLALIEDFVNTVDKETGEEELDTPEALAAWLAGRGLADAGEPFDHDDLARAVAIREHLRALLLANNGSELDPAVPAALGAAADRAHLTVALDSGGRASVTPLAGGIDRIAGRLLGIVARAQAEGSWDRLKACPWHTCHVAFYDHSRNHSRTWCSMAVCGNRAKAQTYRRRAA
jgi:predicted RNA-binding Zn ribbon-like protein